ncbi:MAG: DUF4058 family protein [Cyanobacteria bacterium P01_G01_bin.38]
MPSPFPGMNPYLENPELWPEVHSRLIVAIADVLNPQLMPKYRAAIDRRVYDLQGNETLLVGIPDVTVERRSASDTPAQNNIAVMMPPASPVKVRVPMPIEVRESYLQIKEVATGEVVTVIELLSPTNKRTGAGRNAYEEKRREVLSSRTHLIEIDLLRSGEPMALAAGNLKSHYRILMSRGDQRPQADLYPFNLPDKIPPFPLPLKTGDMEPVIDLHLLLDQVYDRAGYEVVIDYAQPPVPSLDAADAAWAKAWLQKKEMG